MRQSTVGKLAPTVVVIPFCRLAYEALAKMVFERMAGPKFLQEETVSLLKATF